jgi:hypothetical protein
MSDRYGGFIRLGLDTFRDDYFVETPLQAGAASIPAAPGPLSNPAVLDDGDPGLASEGNRQSVKELCVLSPDHDPVGGHFAFRVSAPSHPNFRAMVNSFEPGLSPSSPAADNSSVLYVFEKQQALLQCEVRNTAVPGTFAIVVTDPDGRVRTQYVSGSNHTHRRWLELEQQLRATGWTGPMQMA